VNGHVRARGKRADGTTKWQARYSDPNDPTGRCRIEKTFRSKREAEAWLTQQQASLLRGEHSDPRRADRPFADAVDAWRETRKGSLSPQTADRYEDVLRLYLLPEFGRVPVSALSREVVKRYFARLAREGKSVGRKRAGQKLSAGTIHKIQTVLSAVLSEAVELGILRVNPALRLRLPTPQRKDMTVLTADEVHVLAQAIDPHYRTLIYVAAYTGLRAGELWALRRKDVDLLRGVLHVRQTVKRGTAKAGADPSTIDQHGREVGPPKNGKQRTISLPKHLRDMLGEQMTQPTPGDTGPEGMVFHTATGKAVRHTWFMRIVFPDARTALPEAKRKLRFHDLRHTCATLIISAGGHAKLVQERLGHSSITTTLNLYGHVLPSTEAALVDAMDELYASVGASEAPA
jgi:integrase